MATNRTISQRVIDRLRSPQRLLIDGQWCDAADRSEVINPSDGEVLTTAAAASRDDTDAAVAAARNSFDGELWTGLTPAERGKILDFVVDVSRTPSPPLGAEREKGTKSCVLALMRLPWPPTRVLWFRPRGRVTLRVDDAKCRVITSARAAVLDDGTYAYTVFQQGAGRIDAIAAVNESTVGCANRNMKIKDDLAGRQHYAGLAGVDEFGTYYLVNEYGQRTSGSGHEWIRGGLWPNGALWPERSISNQGALWNTGILFNQASSLNSGSLLSQGALWPEGALWTEGLTEPLSNYLWVNQE